MTIGHHRITIGHYFFSISKYKAKTTELHPKVKPTCYFYFLNDNVTPDKKYHFHINFPTFLPSGLSQKSRKGFIYMIYTGWTKKRVISKYMTITPLKSIRKGISWCVLENSAYMMQDRHQTFQNWLRNG